MSKSKRASNPFAAANMAANRVLKRFDELEPKVKALDDQLTGISTRVKELTIQLGNIEKAVKAKTESVESGTTQTVG